MSAKEMFEKLGYKLEANSDLFIRYYNSNEDIYIWFDKISKTVEIREEFDYKVLQAINKQIEELGWNND